ncbi:hypothetical protein OIU84_007014 [Salix udensis]|uniref:Leucine-rich repeat receptor-like protein kinase n=1 Tax=Salix udensis TaxID=889485 RepID=A0AAD6JZT7_9ROSI|nr:hypothetical protein OIU84_007014 [Salix udensis]
MASIHYEPKLVAILSISFFFSCIFVSSTGLVAALDPALLVSEGNALIESGWWSDNSSYSYLSSNPCMDWPGIVCDRAGSITEISPPPESLKVGNKFGKMNFSCFPNLVRLDLANRDLIGSIPQISTPPQLRYLNLSSNNLQGALPGEIGNMKNLESLDVSYNRLNGPIPLEIGDLKNLESLDVSYNRLNGPIPPTVGGSAKLRSLIFRQNKINGSIPLEIGNLKNLETLDVSYNRLNGPIPPTVGGSAKLRSLIFRQNKINGSIPLEIGNLKNLEFLDLSSNVIAELEKFGRIISEFKQYQWFNSSYNEQFEKLDISRPFQQSNHWINFSYNEQFEKLDISRPF